MSSGQKRIVFNTRERALSTDHNRLQAFVAADRAELVRRQYNDQRKNAYKFPGVSSQNVGGEIPLSADVFGGFMVVPGATSVIVLPGTLGCLFPDPGATADDSPYLLINDPGEPASGVLNFTANASGSIRIDLVECSPVDVTAESDSRDIFNPTTGLFVPATVPKVKRFGLQYRIRVGTGGAGVPTLQAGWLPLAVIVMKSGAADFAACDFYDVRPLVEDRVEPQGPLTGTPITEQFCPVRHAEYYTSQGGGDTLIQGTAESQFNGYRAGGWLRRSSPSFTGSFTGGGVADGETDFVNVANTENQATVFSPVALSIVYLVAFFPSGLPRWVRYSHGAGGDGASGRIPKGPFGILLVTTQPPYPNGVVNAIAIGHGFINAPGVALATLVRNSGNTDYIASQAQSGLHTIAVASLAVSATATSLSVEFTLAPNVDHPYNAAEIQAQLLLKMTSASIEVGAIKVEVYYPGLPTISTLVTPNQSITVPSGTNYIAHNFRIPIIGRDNPVSTGGGIGTTVRVSYTGAAAVFDTTAGVQKLNPFGWRLVG